MVLVITVRMNFKLEPKHKSAIFYTCIIAIAGIGISLMVNNSSVITSSLAQSKVINPDEYEYNIPAWVKDVAGFWAQDLVDNHTYFTSLQWLIDHDYISIKKLER